MQIEKPPITGNLPQFKATDAEIQAVIKSRHLDESGMPLVEQRMAAMTIILIVGVAKAQRDADAAYYEPLIQQAKAEVAREIFEEIEQGYMRGGKHPRMDGIVISTPKSITISEPEWQSLKFKYTEGK